MSNEMDNSANAAAAPAPQESAKAVTDANASSTDARGGVTTRFILLMGAWSLFLCLITGLVVWSRLNATLEQELALRPRVVVIDSFGWIRSAGSGSTTQERYENGARALHEAIAKLKSEGVLVVEKSATPSVPDNVLIKTPDGQKQESAQ